MKEIQSAGGPLIGLPRDHAQLWTGVFGKKFIGDSSPFRVDYEATEYPVGGLDRARRDIAKIIGANGSGILINPPNCTSILDIDSEAIYIAQIDYCDSSWKYDSLKKIDFEMSDFKTTDDVYFSCRKCEYVLFDAAYSGTDFGDDCLLFDLEEGHHILSTARHQPNDSTGLILYKITKADSTTRLSQAPSEA